MVKEIYVFRGSEADTYETFSARIRQVAEEIRVKYRPSALKAVFTAGPPPRLSVIPFKKGRIAAISVRHDGNSPASIVKQMPGFDGAYRVTEALPVAYKKTWADGRMTPGICLLTLFNRKKGLDRETFIDRWHNSHTPLSLRIHPLWNYTRNVVDSEVTPGSALWEGIVEEQFREDADLLNIFRFFGPPHVVVQRMISVYRDTNAFLDYKTIETYLAREIVFRLDT
jgi:hypothetical protein